MANRIKNEYTLSDNHIQPKHSKNNTLFLRALCIFSLIVTGFWIITYIARSLGFSLIASSQDFSNTHLFSGFSALPMIGFSLLALTGIILMWKLKKYGFYLYFAAQFLLFNYPLLVFGTEHFDLNELFFSSVFILLFGINLRYMK